MNFSESLGYSFKGQNIPKILTIVLLFVILGVSIIVAAFATESIAPLFLFGPLLIGFSLFVGGYAISVIKAVADGEEVMPSFNIGSDIGRGFMVVIASIVYFVPLFVVMGCVFAFMGASMGASFDSASADEAAGGAIMMMCGFGLLAGVITFITSYSLIVGQYRYAVEGRAGALFDFGTNFSTVFANLGTTCGLVFRQIGIALIFGIISSILGGAVQMGFAGVMNDLAYINDANDLLELGLPIAAFVSLYYVISMTLTLMQSFSTAHLVAGYGDDLGLRKSKSKNDDMYNDF